MALANIKRIPQINLRIAAHGLPNISKPEYKLFILLLPLSGLLHDGKIFLIKRIIDN
jgi:hypothetical protein